MYQSFKNSVLGKVLGDGQCVALDRSYLNLLFPGVNSLNILPSVEGANELADHGSQYLAWVENDHNDPNQVPTQGDIMVFGPTPEAGFTNTFENPYGHTGVCDSANSNGYSLLQQNAPNTGSPANVTAYAWKYRPCIGWYHPTNITSVAVPPPPTVAEHSIHYPQTIGPVHLYKVGGPYIPAQAKAVLMPSQFAGGITETIVASRGNGVYTIDTADFGQGDVWTNGTTGLTIT